MPKSFTLAHLSDVHLGPIPPLPLAYLNLKRVLGYLNWQRSRKLAHLSATTDALLSDMALQAVDHIAITGDLINIGLPREYDVAAEFLRRVGPPTRVSVVPGNHDIYTTLRGHPGVETWRAYMAGETLAEADEGRPSGFPFVRRFPGLALIGLNSAVPTRPFYAGGLLGPRQRDRLKRILDQLGEERLVRVVLIHHPPLPGQTSSAKALADAEDLAALLRVSGSELVLHGHNHTFTMSHCGGPAREIPIIGVPSASLGSPHKHETLARYHLFRFALDRGEASITLTARGLGAKGSVVGEVGCWQLGAA